MEKGAPELLSFGMAFFVLPQVIFSFVSDKIIAFLIFIPSILLIYIALKREERNEHAQRQ